MILNAWGPMEWILLALIVLLLFGSSQIPKFARSLGQALREFRKAVNEAEQVSQEVKYVEQRTFEQKIVEDPLITLAKNKGINVEGKTRVQIVEELAEKIKQEN
jgi:sec-independent protein translocase protein TatA